MILEDTELGEIQLITDTMTPEEVDAIETDIAERIAELHEQEVVNETLNQEYSTIIAEYNKYHDELGKFSTRANAAIKASKRADAMLKAMESENAPYQKQLDDIASTLKTKALHGPIKKKDRIVEKAVEDYGGNTFLMKDIVRGTIQVQDMSKIDQTLKVVRDKLNVVGEKNSLSFDGYKDYKVTTGLPSGYKAELILATPEMLYAKLETKFGGLGGHDLYNISRDTKLPKAVRDEADAKMAKLYGWAESATKERLAKGETAYMEDYVKKKVKP